MMELAKSHDESEFDQNKGNLRATGESKISNNPQSPELQELMDVILAENKITERAGFEPAVRFNPYTRFPSVLDQPLRHLSLFNLGNNFTQISSKTQA